MNETLTRPETQYFDVREAIRLQTLIWRLLPDRVIRALRLLNVGNLGELQKLRPAALRKVAGIGKVTVEGVRAALAMHDVEWTGELEEEAEIESAKKKRAAMGWTEERRKAQAERIREINRKRGLGQGSREQENKKSVKQTIAPPKRPRWQDGQVIRRCVCLLEETGSLDEACSWLKLVQAVLDSGEEK